MERLEPPPVRRIAVDREPHVVAPTESAANGAGTTAPALGLRAPALRTPADGSVRERMRIESVWLGLRR